MRRLRVAVLALLGAVAAASPVMAQTVEMPWSWRPPAMPEVAWRGMLPTEGGAVGMGGAMLYPAPGLVGFLAAIATHAAISQGVQNAERQKAQADADKVLAPYAAALKDWTPTALWAAARATAPATSPWVLWEGGPAAAPPGPVLETVPIYTMSQDEAVLLLDVAIKRVPAPGAAPQETLVRVVSSPQQVADARAHWSADDARALKQASAAMLAHAIEIALAPPAGEPGEMRTHRYLQGGVERSERGQLLAGDCSRAVLRNLRGWLMSVPVKSAGAEACARATAF